MPSFSAVLAASAATRPTPAPTPAPVSIAPKVPMTRLTSSKDATVNERIIYAIVNSPIGMTCDEIEAQTGIVHQTCSSKIRLLTQRGEIVRTEEKRKTRSNRNAAVYKGSSSYV